MHHIKITCCKKSVIVPDQSDDSIRQARILFGFNSVARDPSLKFYERTHSGMERVYGAVIEPTHEPLTIKPIQWP